jgi:endo-1,4-beta-D-glucanase Y
MKKFTIMMLITLVLFSACRIHSDNEFEGNGNGIELDDEVIDDGSSSGEPSDPTDPSDPSGPVEPSDPTDIIIKIEMSGNVEGDSVTSLSDYGKAGVEITLNYTLADTKQNNRIVFSGTTPAVEEVDVAGSGERKYVIAEDDAVEGVITINAVFTHTDKQLNTIEFADTSNEEIVYGDSFTKAIKNTGYGTGAISYVSSDTGVAAVNSNGTLTIRKVGTTTITAAKAADAVYEKAEARYTLTVTPLQLTITAPTVKTKVYDGKTTANITIGELTNKVKGDTVNVTAVANYNSADVANANMITVVYSIDGASTDNYIKPDDYEIEGKIQKAPGGIVNVNPEAQNITSTSITSKPVTTSTGQKAEYAKAATTTAPSTGWQETLIFSGLNPSTDYYLFARAKESDNYLTGEVKVSSKITTDLPSISIKINMTGKTGGDNVTATPSSGKAGTEITLSYTLEKSKANNRLAFSGTSAAIEEVYSAGTGTAVTGTRTYVIKEADADQSIITINAVFTHAELVLDTIAFANTSNEEKVYGSGNFTKAITNTGSGTGTITYASSDTSVAAVNATSGAVTIVKVGTATITAAKAADSVYAQTTASYTLTVTKLQLTIANPTLTTTKIYNGNTAIAGNVTVGALANKVGSDAVTVEADAKYNSADVASANLITVEYSISGANAGNYIRPANYTIAGTITKAQGADVSGGPTEASKTANSITVNAVTITNNNGNQAVEYAKAEINTAPESGWQDGTAFTGLTANIGYYIFARSKSNANYSAGTAKASAQITTELLANTISFASPLTESRVYGSNYTKVISTAGSGSGAVTYSSSDTSIAAVDNNGAVTLKKVGTTKITASKASDGIYASATAEYTLTVTQLQLTIADPSVTTTKVYNNSTTAAVTAGSLTNKVGSDTVTVSATAAYNSASVASANQITVTYSISGANAGNYIKPANYTVAGTITKADGAATSSQSAGTPSAASKTATSITSSTVSISQTNPGSQTIEYAISTSETLPTSGWQDGKTFDNLTPNTDYYIFARAKENANYNAGPAKTSAKITTDKATITVNIVKSGNTGSDNVTVSPASGTDGTSVTLSYTLSKTEARNRLTFSGTTAAIDEVSSAGTGTVVTGTKTYVIKEADSTDYKITINAVFIHSALELNTIAFANTNNETKEYGSASFTKAITNTGSGTGTISYDSSDKSVATVSGDGAVTIVKVGETTITATKASDGTYASATAEYTLTVTPRQLTKANPTVTTSRAYNGTTTAAVTAVGALNNVKSGDTVTLAYEANYASANAGTNIAITVVYTISGGSAGNYIAPVNYSTTGTITKAAGLAISGTVTGTSTTATSITANAAAITTPNSGGQTVEYAVSTSSTAPSSGWQDGLVFTGLTTGSEYYIYARAKANDNYNAGTAKSSAKIKVDYQNDTIAFADNNNETKEYGSAFTKAITNAGSGTGAITYTSSSTGVATVDAATGAVTIIKTGTTTITATKAKDTIYGQTTASYTLTVTQRQLTIADPTVTTTKTYNGNTTAAVTAGSLTNKVGNDAVTITAAANYNSADAGTGKTITVVYTMSGTGASNYIKPVDYTIAGTITKADGAATSSQSAGTPSAASKTATSITSTTVSIASSNNGNQTIEYAIATSTTLPTSGWQDGKTFDNLTPNTDYYIFARAKENTNYNAGTAKTSAAIKTDSQANTITFSAPLEESKVYGTNFTKAIASGSSGTGTVSYSSSDTSVATVASGGVVTPVKVGTTTITATKAADATYAEAKASYTLTITALQLTKANPTVTTTKTYNGTTTAAVTAVGALSNVKIGDTVSVSAEANYASANVGSNIAITVVYTISGASAGNYIAPVNYSTTGTISKAAGETVTAPVSASKTSTSITVNAITTTNGQTVEYGAVISTSTNTPTTWTDSTTISGLNANTAYNLYARTKSNDNYNAGTAVKSSSTTTTDLSNNVIAFDEPLEVSKPYGATFTKALSSTGSGTGAISYASSDASIATVTNSGVVTPVKAGGPITITATKAANGGYAQATASYTLTITKAAGGTVTAPTVDSKTSTSITVKAVTAPTGQTVEYAAATGTTAPTTGWTDSATISGLTANTAYYLYARAKANDNYNVGTAARTTSTTTTDGLTNTIAFNPTTETKTYGSGTFTKTLSTTGSGTGEVTYSSGDTSIATVNATSGLVTLVKAGTVVITATKKAQGGYPEATASYTLTINKATGGTVSAPTKNSVTSTSITVNAVNAPSTGQTVQYASSTNTTAPGSTSSSWQDGTTISGLTANTNYYVFARAKENDNYNAGAVSSASAQIKTDAAPTATTTVINFESDAVNKDYDFTEGDNKPTSVKVVADPHRSNQKSLQVTSNGPNDKGYNQAAVIPVKLPYTVKDYQTLSFKFSLVSGNTGTNLDSKQIQVYIAKDKATFKKWGFGNDSSASNQFAANLIGAAPSSAVNFDSSYVGKWTDYSITIASPGDAIKDLTGDLFIAIGINCKTNAVYLFDDITFTPKSGFTPPPPPPSAPSTAPNPPSTGAVSSKNYRNMFTEFGYSSAEVTAKVNNAWNKLFVNGTSDEKIYVESGSDMAYIYTADTEDVRSEGMSYGMMMCVQMNDQARFNKLWKWARTYMYNTVNNGSNNRGYFSWQCGTNGNKKDQGPAPDGEVYFVTSLLFAHARWGSSSSGINNYAQEARQIIYDLTRRDSGGKDPYGEPSMFNTTNYLIRFATIGNSATHTDPSYHLPAFLECWALELESDYNANKLYGIWKDKADLKTDVDFFKKAAEESRKYFVTATNSTTGLGPDYSEFNGTPCGGNHADFRFDAWRIAMNIGMDYAWWAKDSWEKTFANRIQAFFKSKGISTYKNQWKLDGTVIEGDHSPGLVGCNAVASLAASHVNAWEFIEDFWNIPMTTGKYRYYDGCLYMMCMLHLSGNFKAYLTSNTTPANSSSITPTTATFDKKSGAANYKDIAVSVTLNGNTFSNIKNGSTSLTSGTDYSSSGTTYTIKKEYLAKQAEGTTTLTFNFSGGASPELTVTITDSSSSSISPTTATFDKKTGAQADIAVTMTLNGNTLSNIKNGSTTLTSGTDYSTSGSSTVSIKKEYLAKQANGTVTLTFTFSAGAAQSIAITVKDTTGGTAGTSYNFANDNLPNGYPKYSSSDISATITGGVLVVTKTGGYSTPKITLPFSVTGNLSGYTGIKINVKGVSGDFQNKQLYAGIGSTNLGSVNNAPIPNNGSFGDVTIPISGGTNTGDIEISFWLNNTQAYVLEIKSIELVK